MIMKREDSDKVIVILHSPFVQDLMREWRIRPGKVVQKEWQTEHRTEVISRTSTNLFLLYGWLTSAAPFYQQSKRATNKPVKIGCKNSSISRTVVLHLKAVRPEPQQSIKFFLSSRRSLRSGSVWLRGEYFLSEKKKAFKILTSLENVWKMKETQVWKWLKLMTYHPNTPFT